MMTDAVIDCACVIHGDKYDWEYVERLYSMIHRHMSRGVRFHVFTEKNRSVPGHMIKHDLTEWPGISGPRKSWWYKMQLFDPSRISGQILYLDLDVVIVDTLDWMCDLDPGYFWTIRDWRHLWKPLWHGMNSSVMYWDNGKFSNIWKEFCDRGIGEIAARYRGDQDFINAMLPEEQRRFFQDDFVLSWRWQIKDGGMDIKTRAYKNPGAGSVVPPGSKILIFHGDPKPHEIQDPIIIRHWTG